MAQARRTGDPVNDERRPRQEPVTRNLARRQRRAAKRGPGKPGGITAGCGCRYVRTGGQWVHVRACRAHQLKVLVADEDIVTPAS